MLRLRKTEVLFKTFSCRHLDLSYSIFWWGYGPTKSSCPCDVTVLNFSYVFISIRTRLSCLIRFYHQRNRINGHVSHTEVRPTDRQIAAVAFACLHVENLTTNEVAVSAEPDRPFIRLERTWRHHRIFWKENGWLREAWSTAWHAREAVSTDARQRGGSWTWQQQTHFQGISYICPNILNSLIVNLTFQELSEKSELLARHLQSLGVKKDSIVGIFMERSADYVIAYIAILRAGCLFDLKSLQIIFNPT